MRRMYSEQELSVIVYQVMGQYIENGAFNQTITDYIDAYLVEHPIDPTAITGLDIAPKNITASGNITAPSIIENMSGYSVNYLGDNTTTDFTNNINYVGICKNGNKLTIVLSGSITKLNSSAPSNIDFCSIFIPSSIGEKLVNNSLGYISNLIISMFDTYYSFKSCPLIIQKFDYDEQQKSLRFRVYNLDTLTQNTPYAYRIEVTFLLSNNLI